MNGLKNLVPIIFGVVCLLFVLVKSTMAEQMNCYMNAQNDMVCDSAEQGGSNTTTTLEDEDRDPGGNNTQQETSVIIFDSTEKCDADGNPTKHAVGSTSYDDGEVTVTQNGHPYKNGDKVTITGADNPAFNGTFTVKKISDNEYSYEPVTEPRIWASGTVTLSSDDPDVTLPMIQSIEFKNGKAVVTTQQDHELTDGLTVTLSGMEPEEFNGTYEINASDTNEFTYIPDEEPKITEVAGNVKTSEKKVDSDGNGVHDPCDESEEEENEDKDDELAKLEKQIKELEDMIKKLEEEMGKMSADERKKLEDALKKAQQGGQQGGGQNPLQDLMKKLAGMQGQQGSPPGSPGGQQPPGSPPGSPNPNAPPAPDPNKDSKQLTDQMTDKPQSCQKPLICDLQKHASAVNFGEYGSTWQTINFQALNDNGASKNVPADIVQKGGDFDGKHECEANKGPKDGQSAKMTYDKKLGGGQALLHESAISEHRDVAKEGIAGFQECKAKNPLMLKDPTSQGHCVATAMGAASYSDPSTKAQLDEARKALCSGQTCDQAASKITGSSQASKNLQEAIKSLCKPSDQQEKEMKEKCGVNEDPGVVQQCMKDEACKAGGGTPSPDGKTCVPSTEQCASQVGDNDPNKIKACQENAQNQQQQDPPKDEQPQEPPKDETQPEPPPSQEEMAAHCQQSTDPAACGQAASLCGQQGLDAPPNCLNQVKQNFPAKETSTNTAPAGYPQEGYTGKTVQGKDGQEFPVYDEPPPGATKYTPDVQARCLSLYDYYQVGDRYIAVTRGSTTRSLTPPTTSCG